MPQSMIRIAEEAKETLRLISEQTGESMQSVLGRAIESYRRKRFLEEVNRAYAAVRGQKKDWTGLEEERGEWDASLTDGLDSSERWAKK